MSSMELNANTVCLAVAAFVIPSMILVSLDLTLLLIVLLVVLAVTTPLTTPRRLLRTTSSIGGGENATTW